MGNTLIKVNCVDQRLIVSNNPLIAAGGKNEDRIEFTFCPLWEGFEKTVVFYRDVHKAVYHIPVVDDACIIPHEVIADEGWMYFGVFGTLDDVRRTTEIMKYHIERGAITGYGLPSDPTSDIYAQYLAQVLRAETAANNANSAAERADTAANNANSAASSSVRYDTAQTLTGEQQDQARANIGAASDMDVIELKGDLRAIIETDLFPANLEWEQGTINQSGTNASSDTYIRTKRVNSFFAKYVSLTISNGYRVYLFQYNENEELLSRNYYNESVFNISVAGSSYIRLVLCLYPTLDNITPDQGNYAKMEMLTNTADAFSKTLTRRYVLDSIDDLDSIMQSGNYQIGKLTYPQNMPVDASGSCLLSVFEYGSNMVLQVVSSPSFVWYRRSTSSGFESWKRFATTTEVAPLSDEVIGFMQAINGGTVTPSYEIGTISTGSGNNSQSEDYVRTKGYITSGLNVSISNMDSSIYVFKYNWKKDFIGYSRSDHVNTEDCAYIRIAYRTSDVEAAQASVVSIAGFKPELKYTQLKGLKSNLMAAFKRFAVIGDSMAAGHLYPSETSTSGNYDDKSVAWGTFLSRKLNTTYYNFSIGGATTKSFVTGIKSDGVTPNGDNNIACALDGAHDVPLYFIGLGLNDNSKLTIGSIEDITFSDYTQNGDTFYGWYGQIIQRIVQYYVAQNLPVTLVLMTPPRWGISNSLHNLVAPHIRNLYEGMQSYVENANCHLYLMDLNIDNAAYYTDFVQGQIINNHYASIGYNMCANDILERMNDIIWDNPSAFKRIDQNPCNTYITNYSNPENWT